jgi:putative phage-type endonuclease
MQQYSEEWKKARRGKLTASMAGAILGVDPNCTRDQLMKRLRAEWQGLEPEFTGNVATEWGHANEETARNALSRELGFAEITNGSFTAMGEIFGASPDGHVIITEDMADIFCLHPSLVGRRATVEIKCPYSMRNATKDEEFKVMGNGELPHYYAQVQMQLMCSGEVVAVFYQWCPTKTQVEFIERDRKFIDDMLLPEMQKFYFEYLELREKPLNYVPPQIADLIAEYDDLAQSIEMAETRKKEVLAEIVKLSGNKNAEYDGRKLTKVEKAGSISYAKALKKYAPDADIEPFRGAPTMYWKLS